jgi:cellulose biosynthesis protein BcsQ
MKIVSCVGAKGGSGKSSVTMLLAWELAKNHQQKVAILDADVQGTCLSAQKLNGNLPFAVYPVGNKQELYEKGRQLEQEKYDVVIIDGNPRSIHEDSTLIEMIAKLSDLSLIISRPSPRDIKAQVKYLETAKKSGAGQIRLLWNFFQKNTAAHREGIPQGEKLLGVKSIKTRLGLRVAYQDVGYAECSIDDTGNREAILESKALGQEIKEILNGK